MQDFGTISTPTEGTSLWCLPRLTSLPRQHLVRSAATKETEVIMIRKKLIKFCQNLKMNSKLQAKTLHANYGGWPKAKDILQNICVMQLYIVVCRTNYKTPLTCDALLHTQKIDHSNRTLKRANSCIWNKIHIVNVKQVFAVSEKNNKIKGFLVVKK